MDGLGILFCWNWMDLYGCVCNFCMFIGWRSKVSGKNLRVGWIKTGWGVDVDALFILLEVSS